MRRTIKLISLIAMTLLIYSCGQNAHKENVLKLDNGSKWKANSETTTGISNMVQIMDSFNETENSMAYGNLKSKLENEFNMIFKNCTMKGEAHNQLHNFLFPMKDMFGGLASPDLKSQKENFDHLKEHLTEYSNYFE